MHLFSQWRQIVLWRNWTSISSKIEAIYSSVSASLLTLFFQTPSLRRMSAKTQLQARSRTARLSCYHLSRFDSSRTSYKNSGAIAIHPSAAHSATIAKKPTSSWREAWKRTQTGSLPPHSASFTRSANWGMQSSLWCRILVIASILIK